jgi:acyl carrier protein
MEQKFKEIIAQYAKVPVEEITDDKKFREDLGLTSLDFMSLLGELEDEFDVEFEEENAATVFTVADALEIMKNLTECE